MSCFIVNVITMSRLVKRREKRNGARENCCQSRWYNDDNNANAGEERDRERIGISPVKREVAAAGRRTDLLSRAKAPSSSSGESLDESRFSGIEKNIGYRARVGTGWIDREEIVAAVASSALAPSPRKTVRRESLSRPEGTLWPQNRTIGQVGREREREREDTR